MMMLDRVEMQPGMTPAAFPPPIFSGSTSVSVFLCLRPISSRDHDGILFIDGFRSKQRRWHEKRGDRRSDGRTRPGGAVPLLGRATHALSGLRAPLVRSKCSRPSSS